MRVRIPILLVAFFAGGFALGSGGGTLTASGEQAEVVRAAKRPPLVDPRDSGRRWMRSRPKPVSIVWAVGDGADGGAAAQAVAEMIASRRVDRLLYLGDVYESGTAQEYETNYRPTWGRFDRIAAPTIGNHEWANASAGYIPYWTGAKGSPPSFWYAFAASGWQLISLNSNPPLAQSPAQKAWLSARIKKTPGYGDCRIAFFHHPIHSASRHGDTDGLERLASPLDRDASIVLSGHDHNLQRMRPINGITQLISGAGGRELYPIDEADPRLGFFDDTHHGALRLKLRQGIASASFIASDGTVLDRSVIRCDPQDR